MSGTGAADPLEVTFEAEVLRVTFERDDSSFRVIKASIAGRKEPVSIIGHFPKVAAGAVIRVRGVPEVDKKHGAQVRALAVTELAPRTLKGLARYLGSGIVKGVGPRTAQKLVDEFGMKTLEILDEHPEQLIKAGITPSKAERIGKTWQAHKDVREVMVMLQGYGVSPALAERIFKRYGAGAPNVVGEQPYKLAMDVRGIGFTTADKIAQQVGIAKDAPERIQAGLLQALSDATEGGGHTCVPRDEWMNAAGTLLGGVDAKQLENARRALLLGGHVIEEREIEEPVYFTRTMHTAELRLAERLHELAASHVKPLGDVTKLLDRYENDRAVRLARAQREAVEQAGTAPVLVVTGGPGVGKTTIVRAILALFDDAKIPVRLAAPTGRAAKRMSEATGREAQTLHRLLEFDPKRATFKRDRVAADRGGRGHRRRSVDDRSFARRCARAGDRAGDAARPRRRRRSAPERRARRRACATSSRRASCRGAPHADLPPGRGEPHRRERAPHQRGEVAARPDSDPNADFFVIERARSDAARDTVLELVRDRIPRRFGLDPVRDVQVLTPMHRGDAGAIALNEALQAALNPRGDAITRGAERSASATR